MDKQKTNNSLLHPMIDQCAMYRIINDEKNQDDRRFRDLILVEFINWAEATKTAEYWAGAFERFIVKNTAKLSDIESKLFKALTEKYITKLIHDNEGAEETIEILKKRNIL